MPAGRPTELTKELRLEIRKLVLLGKNQKDIVYELEIAKGTWDTWFWENYQDFRNDIRKWKQERMIAKAEETMGQLIDSEDENIKFKSSEFILSTLDKETFSKRSELTGKNGERLVTPDLTSEQKKRLAEEELYAHNRAISSPEQPSTIDPVLPYDGQELRTELAPPSDSGSVGTS